MRLLLIHQAFSTPDEGGGTRHYEFARHGRERGVDVTVVAGDASYLTGAGTGRGPASEEHVDGVRVLRAYTLKTLHKSFVWRVGAFLSFMATSFWAAMRSGPCEIVMGTTPPIFQAGSAWLVARLRRRPFLLEVRDLWPEFAIDMGVLTNPLLIRLSRWLERFLYSRADHILVNSPAYRDYLIRRKGIDPAKVTLIPNGVDPGMFEPGASGEGIREEFGLGEKFVVTYAGALGPANDIYTILRAAETLRDRPAVHFLLLGDGKERPALEAWAADRHLTNVTFAGKQPKRRVARSLAASDACVATLKPIPMFTTTYPNKVFDYMAAGRPTLLAIDGVIREVLDAAGGGVFVPPGDHAALAAAAGRLHDDPAAAEAMGRRAREYVCAHFNRRDQAEQFVHLVTALASGQRDRLLTEEGPACR
ncbi:MAG: glycosyltransferase family 4 protein [Planctomycetota bacterium]